MPIESSKDLVNCVKHWLDYQITLKRVTLLSESYMGQPIAEYFLGTHNGEIETEFDHPNLQKAARGRPKQVDYVLLGRNTRRLEVAIEAKWIDTSTTSKQRIVDDMLRLECLRSEDGHVERYFLVAGLVGNMQDDFLDAQANSGGGRISFFHTLLPQEKGKQIEMEIKDSNPPYRNYYMSFAKGYKVSLPERLKIELVEDEKGEGVRIMLWKISSNQKRQTFDALTDWAHLIVPDDEE